VGPGFRQDDTECFAWTTSSIWRISPVRSELGAVELFLELMERVVADRLALPQVEDGAARGQDGAAPDGISGQFARGNAAIGIVLGLLQDRAIFQPQQLGLLGRIVVDLLQRRPISDAAGAGDLVRDESSSFSPSAKISGRSVRPWITSEPSTTAKAVNRIRSR
jgi:hypothetical protein